MISLETLSTSQTQRILLIGIEDWLVELIKNRFKDYDLIIVELSATDFLNLDQVSLDQETIYKIIWWVNFDDLQITQQVLVNLQNLTDSSIIILGMLPEIFLLESEELPEEMANSQEFFITVVNTLATAQFFFTRDLFKKEELPDSLKFSFRGYQKKILLDPQDHWFFLNQVDFFNAVEPYLTRPHSAHRALIQGRKQISSVILKKTADLMMRYYRLSLEVMSVIAERFSPQLPNFVTAVLQTQTMGSIDELIRHKEIWEGVARNLPSPEGKQWRTILTEEKTVDKNQFAATDDLNELILEEQSSETFKISQKRQRINEGKRLVNQHKDVKKPSEKEQIEGELARIFHQKRSEKKKRRIDNKVRIVKKIAQKSQKNKALFFSGMTTMVAGGIVLLLWGVLSLSTVFARREMLAFFATYNLKSSAIYSPGFWTKTLTTQVNFYEKSLNKEWLGASGELVEFSEDFIDLKKQQAELDWLASQYLLTILGKGESSPDSQMLEERIVSIQQATSQLISSAELVLSDAENLENIWLNDLQQSQQIQTLARQLPDTLAKIFGAEGKQTYAVLLQNNLELRPTGGFIQAIGFFTFDQGLLVDSQFVSPYDLDQRILASVLAPAEIKKYLGEEKWYLRDSNWNPDFPETALRIAWFIRQSVGLQVDGVWAINYLTFKNILAALGPLELTDYNELLTDKNLLERVEFHSDDELTNAKGQQQEYALMVFTQFFQHLQTMSTDQAIAFLRTLKLGLANKQILISFFEQEQAEIMGKMDWDGQIVNPTCPNQFSQAACLVDQIFQVEANIGLNRVGAYIKREIEHHIDLAGEKVTHTRVVRLENTSRSDGWPLGNYKAYLRFILDSEAKPSSVTVNGQRLTSDQLMIYGEGGRRVVGLSVEIPKQSTTTIEFSYLTELIPQGSFSYLLFDQQQSGIEETPVKITIYNPNKKATLVAPIADLYGDSVEFNQIKNDHLFVGAQF